MSLHNLRPPTGARQKKGFRVGRGHGSGNGKTAGRGHKGAQSRSGWKTKRGFEGGQMPLHRRIPKRGFHNPFRTEYAVINLDVIASAFAAGSVVTPEVLRERGFVHHAAMPVKVLGRGEITVALTIHADKFSESATKKIVAAGGKTETLGLAPAEAAAQ
jgi:large subunit ribosomal protein L15